MSSIIEMMLFIASADAASAWVASSAAPTSLTTSSTDCVELTMLCEISAIDALNSSAAAATACTVAEVCEDAATAEADWLWVASISLTICDSFSSTCLAMRSFSARLSTWAVISVAYLTTLNGLPLGSKIGL